MLKKVLIAGNDLNTQKLLVDILEITFNNVSIDKITTTIGLLTKLKSQVENYHLIIIDSFNTKSVNEDLFLDIRINHPTILNNLILLFDSLEGIPDSNILFDIPYITKPFSLDVIGELLEKVCIK